jgi:hypothetical protein
MQVVILCGGVQATGRNQLAEQFGKLRLVERRLAYRKRLLQ